MNFIVAALIYHSNAEIAFLLFITLIEEYGLYEIYMELLPGLDKHCRAIERHIQRQLPQLYDHFCMYNITVEMFATEWVIGLFCSVIPLEQIGVFLDSFFEYRWEFFYKVVVAFLAEIEEDLKQEEELSDILNSLKNNSRRSEEKRGKFFRKVKQWITLKSDDSQLWLQLIGKAREMDFN